MRFDLGFSVVPALIPVSLVILLFLLRRQRYLGILLSSSASFLITYFFGWEAAVACFSVFQVLLALFYLVDVGKFLFWLFVLLAGFEALALIHWVFFVPLGLSSPLGSIAILEMELFYIASFFSPYLGLILIFISILKPLVRLLSGEGLAPEGGERRSASNISSKVLVSLVFIVSLSVVAAVYPYFPSVNPKGLDVGVDIRNYTKAAELVEGDVSQVFHVMNGSRPIIFLAIFGFQKLAGLDALTAVRFFPVMLIPLLVLSVFFLALEVLGDDSGASLAAFFTVCGYTVSVGMFSYYLANMLGLSLAFTSLALLFMAMRSGYRLSLLFASLFGGLIVFTHPWTFDQYFFAIVLMAGLMIYDVRVRGKDHKNILFLMFYVVSLGLSELVKVAVFHGVGGASASTTVVSGFTTLSKFWYDLEYFFMMKYGGFMSNLVLVGLALVGLLLYGFWSIPNLYFKVFLGLTSLGFLVGNEMMKSRLFYNISLGIFAASGLLTFYRWEKSDSLKWAASSFFILNMIVYLFRSLANLI